MSQDSEQQKVLSTIRERDIILKLSDKDVQRLWEKAGSVGISVNELLENVIGDLVFGTYSNGPDGRRIANEWFEQCGFAMFPDNTFLRYLINWESNMEDTIRLWDDIKNIREEIDYATTHKDEFTEEVFEELKENLGDREQELQEIYTEFKAGANQEGKVTLEEEMEKVVTWYQDMKQMRDGTENKSSQV